MEYKGFAIFVAIVLCTIPYDNNVSGAKLPPDTGSGNLKCVQCGISPEQAMREAYLHSEAQMEKMKAEFSDNPYKFVCPPDLPKPTECKSSDDRYCIKVIDSGKRTSIRFCSAKNNGECNENACVYSCETDGCNVSEHANIDSKFVVIIAILGLLIMAILS